MLVVVAHPDDEILGCGALLSTLPDVRVAHVTDGAPRDARDARRNGFDDPAAYAEARRREAETALALAGVTPERIIGLAVPDGEAAHRLSEVIAAVAPLVAAADVVLTHAFEGGHPDHDATALAVDACCRRLAALAPKVFEMPFYHADEDGWVRQRFLPRAGDETNPVYELSLDPAQRALKRHMLAAHATQVETLKAFGVEVERFRPAVEVDFTSRPHDKPLLYERHGWNLTWPVWQSRAREALRALG